MAHSRLTSARNRRVRRLWLEKLESRVVLDSTVVFNEIMYHPAGDDPTSEWVELHNQMAVDMDISDWYLDGGVQFSFEPGTIIPGGGYLVVAASPSDLEASARISGVLGPLTGRLANGGEVLQLRNNNDRFMDEIDYGDNDPWPVGPDGSGASLAKLDPNSATAHPQNWATSETVGGTPGAANHVEGDRRSRPILSSGAQASIRVPVNDELGNRWTLPEFDDEDWTKGPTGVGYDSSQVEYSEVILADKPIGYWRFEEASGVTAFDSSGNNRDGTYSAGISLGSPGSPLIGGKSATFDGSTGFVDLPGSWGGGSEATVEAWVNTSGSSDFQSIVSGHDPNAFVHFQMFGGGNTGVFTNGGFIGTPIVPDAPAGVWRHVTLVAAPGNTRVYVDGVQLGSSAADSFENILSSDNVDIGLGHANGRWFNGQIDEVAIYDRALSEGQILAHHAAGSGAAGFAHLIETDVTAQMRNQQSSAYLRVPFDVADLASIDQLQLRISYDDGFIAYLNGVEIAARNAPISPNFDSSATADRPDGSAMAPETIDISSQLGQLRSGANVLAIQGLNDAADSSNFLILPELLIRTSTAASPIALNEVAGATDGLFSLELVNYGDGDLPLGGYTVTRSSNPTDAYVMPNQNLPPGGFLTVTEAELGFRAASDESLFLYSPGGNAVVDAVVVNDSSRGRFPDGSGRWLYPDVATPQAPNHFDFHDDIVINEIMYHHRSVPPPAAVVENPTPIPIGATWRFDQSGADLGTAWRNPDFDDVAWKSGAALFFAEESELPAPKATPLTLGHVTYYFRTEFDYSGDTRGLEFKLRPLVDDGAVFYLNGVEVYRLRMPDGEVTSSTGASTGIDNAAFATPVKISTDSLVQGRNVLAVEVHQERSRSRDVVFGTELLIEKISSADLPFLESTEEWIELYNRSDHMVDLTGWRLEDAVEYEFEAGTTIPPRGYLVVTKDTAAMAAENPGITIVGNFARSLSNRSDRILLTDVVGNPADEVRYFDDGRWSDYADGGGATLELRNPNADNSVAEAWAPSDERGRSPWSQYSYRRTARNVLGPMVWNELVFGLLDEGEILLDDISVIEDPDGEAVEILRNGSFTSGIDAWRVIGNHHGEVITDPDDPTNLVLRLVARGSTEHWSNHAETTFTDRMRVRNGMDYEISYRAKWIGGSNQLNSRLYFNRVAQTTRIAVPERYGTPGAQNSRFETNLGPTYGNFQHSPVVPEPGEPVTVSAIAADPNGVDTMTLWYSIQGGAWVSAAMAQVSFGADNQTGIRFSASIPGQAASTFVQFYVEGQDTQGATSTFPSAGPDSRALFRVQDGQADLERVHNLRIIMTDDDADFLHLNSNVMSNDLLGATVVYDEQQVFYDVGVRLKGSSYGRPIPQFVSFIVDFHPDNLFRGVHDSVRVDRSGRGPVGSPGQDEILIKHMINHAGGLPGMYDDLVRIIAPRRTHTSFAILSMAAYENIYLDSQYENGSDSTLFELDGAYYTTRTTDGDPQSLKAVAPGPISYTDIRDLGDDKEQYRWNFLIKNNRDRDDYDRILQLGKAFDLRGAALDAATRQVIDVDEWMRLFAMLSLVGIGDVYTHGNPHNLWLYVRPSDQRILALPHDNDVSFARSTSAALTGNNGNLLKVIALPGNQRRFHGHLYDLIETTYNRDYMEYWTSHYGSLVRQSYGSILSYIGRRASTVLNRLPEEIPFEITTNDGTDFTVDDPEVTLQGNAWYRVKQIFIQGRPDPLQLTWTDADSWEAQLPLAFGENVLDLQGFDYQGNQIASDRITVTTTAGTPSLDAVLVSEIMYNPDGSDDFEFVELLNTSDANSVNLAGAAFTDGIDFTFPSHLLRPGARAVVVKNVDAFRSRYGLQVSVIGQFSGSLNNAGERLTLVDSVGTTVVNFSYSDNDPWSIRADGDGSSLELIDPGGTSVDELGKYYRWRASSEVGGSPGAAGAGPIGVVVNEVLANTDAPQVDAIELYNTTGEVIDIGGWFLSDSANDPLKYQIPSETSIQPFGYLLFTEEDFNPSPQSPLPHHFALNGSRGDDVWLVIPNGVGGVMSFVDDVHFTAAAVGRSWGRTPNGADRLAPLNVVTLGSENSPPKAGSVVISELNYNPGQPSRAALLVAATLTSNDLEFIEILNTTDEVVDLTQWQVRQGIDFDFPPGRLLAPSQAIVLVSFDPVDANNASRLAAFRTHYSIDQNVVLAGDFKGRLDNSGEAVQLLRPGDPPPNEPAFIPRLLEDEVLYDDRAPWPVQADGNGRSLTRAATTAYGNAAGSWMAAVPTPGTIVFSGDFNGDGRTDAADINLLAAGLRANDPQFDLTGDNVVDQADMAFLVQTILGTNFGDANLDGIFNSSDLVQVFRVGEYEDGVAGNSSWADGDWNGDGDFDTGDMVLAFRSGGFIRAVQSFEIRRLEATATRGILPHVIAAAVLSAAEPNLELQTDRSGQRNYDMHTRTSHLGTSRERPVALDFVFEEATKDADRDWTFDAHVVDEVVGHLEMPLRGLPFAP